MIAKNVVLGAMSLLLSAGIAVAAEPKADFFHGKWIINDTNCADASAEFSEISKTGAIQTFRSGRVESSGIWELKDGMVEAHLVSSPAYFSDNFPDSDEDLTVFDGEFFAFFVRIVPFNVQANSFDAIGLLGDQVVRGSFQRCPS